MNSKLPRPFTSFTSYLIPKDGIDREDSKRKLLLYSIKYEKSNKDEE